MNVAIVHPYPVHAAAPGGVTRVHALARYLSRRHSVSIFTHDDGRAVVQPDLEVLGIRQQCCSRPRARVWRKLLWSLDQSAPYHVHYNASASLEHAVAAADSTVPFDVAHLEFGYMAPAVRGLGPRTARVLAEQEVMPLALERLDAIPPLQRTPYEHFARATVGRARAFDRATLPRFDLLYGINTRERDYLASVSNRPVSVLPHVVESTRFSGRPTLEAVRPRVLFIGNFAHRPNVHALRWFLAHVWPLVRVHHAEVRLSVAGPALGSQLPADFAGLDVEWCGYVEDLPDLYRSAAIVVNPVLTGGGMRGKVLEALASGAALVSTALGLEGVAAQSGQHCLVADDVRGFASAVATYIEAPHLRRQHGEAGRRLVSRHYDAEVVFSSLERDYERVVEGRRSGRGAL